MWSPRSDIRRGWARTAGSSTGSSGGNAPLILSEVERGGPVVDLAIPAFCVTEVSDDERFRNEYLAHRPFGAWADAYLHELDATGPAFIETLGRNQFDGT